MESKLMLHNTLTRRKELFEALNPPHVGLYVCGPTVYGDPHLGHARSAITFDLLFRYLTQTGYRVRYVRNITDVGHLEHDDGAEGEDKLEKRAKLENLEPMEIAQIYTLRYHEAMNRLGVLPPSIEPRASGHIIEQIEFIKKIIDSGYGYLSNGSVYFDVEAYAKNYDYGELSGRVLEEMRSSSRTLEGGGDKRAPFDFALWKKASPEHIMRWPSPWSEGFPGWHLECSAMSEKYLGKEFDIHGGGMDLIFPHHECEIAQNRVVSKSSSARYWLHNNMVNIDGQKMGKSLGNSINLNDFFTGEHESLTQAFSPMAIRFFTLQAHYRSTLDFSEEAMKASEKGLERLMTSLDTLESISPSPKSSVDVSDLEQRYRSAMDDDLNSPMVISALFDWVRIINQLKEGAQTITQSDLERLKKLIHTIVFEVLGLSREAGASEGRELAASLMELILDLRATAREEKSWAMSDHIRDELARIGVVVKDGKDGAVWEMASGAEQRKES